MLVAELLQYAGPELLEQLTQVVIELLQRAAYAEDGMEAEQWPAECRVGLVIPLWKKKGCIKDKNTYRGDHAPEHRLQNPGTHCLRPHTKMVRVLSGRGTMRI